MATQTVSTHHTTTSTVQHPIGIFDSGYGGLTVFREIARRLPQYSYIYLGDNARNPYGPRSFETVYEYTWECVQHLFDMGCKLVILACNTASAKALRTIQQTHINTSPELRRVLGVIRPTAETIGHITQTGHVGILATKGTVLSQSYTIEINHFWPELQTFQQACPMWVPLVENNEHLSHGADFFVRKYLDELLQQSPDMDTIVLGCTHYPLLAPKISQYLPPHIRIVTQGNIVADSLADYLQRHPEIDNRCARGDDMQFFTTESPEDFDTKATIFFGKPVRSQHLDL